MTTAHLSFLPLTVRRLLLFALLLGAIFTSVRPIAAQVPVWSDTQTVGDITYFLRKSPAQIMRYDLKNTEWQVPIALDAIPSAFVVDPPYIFIAYGRVLKRMDLDGTNAVHITNTSDDIGGLLIDGNLLFLNRSDTSSTRVISLDKTTFAVLDEMKGRLDILTGASIARSINKIFGSRTNTRPSDISWATYSDDGMFLAGGDSPYHGDYPAATRTWLSPDETMVLDDSGTIYKAANLTYHHSFGVGKVIDLAFHGTDIPIVLTGNELISFSNTILETGRYSLAKSAQGIVIYDEEIFAFQEDSAVPGKVAVEIVDLKSLTPRQTGQPISPIGLEYAVDSSALGSDGIVYLLSKSLNSLFRWDLSTQSYLETIPLPEACDLMAYAEELNRLYIYALSKKVYRIDLENPNPNAVHHTTAPLEINTMIPLGADLLIVYNGSFKDQWIYDANGSLLVSNVICCHGNFHLYDPDAGWVYYDNKWRMYLGNGEFSAENREPKIYGFKPLALSTNGQLMVDGGGKIYNAANLQQIDLLSNNILAATWNSSGNLFTIKKEADTANSRLQRWTSGSVNDVERRITGTFRQVFSYGADIVIITSVENRPVVTTLTSDLKIIPPSTLAPPILQVTWFSATAATLAWDGIFGAESYVIERRLSTVTEWEETTTVPFNKNTFTDATLSPGVIYEFRLKAKNGEIESDYSEIAFVDLQEVVDERIDPRTVIFTPDDAIISTDDKIYLLSKEHESIFVWNATTQSWANTIPLRGTAAIFSYSAENNSLYTIYTNDSVRKIDLSNENPVEVEFTKIITSKRSSLIAAGEFVIVNNSITSSANYVSLDADGNVIDRFRNSYYFFGGPVWSPANRRIYYLRDDISPNDLNSIDVNADGFVGETKSSPYHSSVGMRHPVRIDPLGTIVILGSGRIYDADTLEQIDSLAFEINDAVWLNNRLVTLTDKVIHSYSAFNYGASPAISLRHNGLRLFSTSDGNLVSISQNSQKQLFFDVFGPDFNIVAPETLAQPASLTTRIMASKRIALSWSDVAGEVGYQIERRGTESETWEEIGAVAYNVTSFDDTGVTAGASYAYRIIAFNSSIESAPSPESIIKLAAPNPPMEFTGVALDASRLQLNWKFSPGANGYKLSRIKTGDPTSILVRDVGSVSSFLDSGLAPATTYEYRVQATNPLGISGSAVTTATTDLIPPYLPSLNIFLGPFSVGLTWSTDALTSETVIERRNLESSQWKEIAVLPAPTTSHKDDTVEREKTYLYRVYNRNTAGPSPFSYQQTITVPKLNPPTRPALDPIFPESSTSLLISWQPGFYAEGYRLFYRIAGSETWSSVTEFGPDETNFLHTGLINRQTYEYRLTAWNEAGESPDTLFSGTPREYVTLLQDDFSAEVSPRLWHKITGGLAIDGGPGFDTGAALWFSGSGNAQTMAVDTSEEGLLYFAVRAGDQGAGESFYWKKFSGTATLRLQFSTDGNYWQGLQQWSLTLPYLKNWMDVVVDLPTRALGPQVRFRWITAGSLGTWAIDNVRILGVNPGPIPPVEYVQPFVLNSSMVRLSWPEPTAGQGQPAINTKGMYLFQIERRIAGSNWQILAWTEGGTSPNWTDYTAPSGEMLFYRVRTLAPWDESIPSLHATVTMISQLKEWRLLHFGVSGDTGPSADTATDSLGTTNLEHYAFGTEVGEYRPRYERGNGPTGTPLAVLSAQPQSLHLTFPRRDPSTNPEIDYIVEFSDDLVNWTPQTEPATIIRIQGNWQEVRYAQPVSVEGTTRSFVRVRIVRN